MALAPIGHDSYADAQATATEYKEKGWKVGVISKKLVPQGSPDYAGPGTYKWYVTVAPPTEREEARSRLAGEPYYTPPEPIDIGEAEEFVAGEARGEETVRQTRKAGRAEAIFEAEEKYPILKAERERKRKERSKMDKAVIAALRKRGKKPTLKKKLKRFVASDKPKRVGVRAPKFRGAIRTRRAAMAMPTGTPRIASLPSRPAIAETGATQRPRIAQSMDLSGLRGDY